LGREGEEEQRDREDTEPREMSKEVRQLRAELTIRLNMMLSQSAADEGRRHEAETYVTQ
jgi:hypothetical protein